MDQLTFETLSFQEKEDVLQVTLLNLFTTNIPLNEMPEFNLINPNTIETNEKPFSLLLTRHLNNLTNNLTKNKATYVHQNSGLPLIGNVSFGITYRNTSLIEIKTVTSCNLNCLYCSISEGIESKKHDYVVEKDYLIDELKKLLRFVQEPIEIHIGVQGEPFLYADTIPLIEDLQNMEQVHTISINTNATLLTKEIIDQLAINNKLRYNFSLDAINPEVAKKMSGVNNYNLNHVLEMIRYATEKSNVLIAPVCVFGYNDQEMEKIIEFTKSLPKKVPLGIQNFLNYKTGRNPAKAKPWSEFFAWIKELEDKHQISLKVTKEDFNIKDTKLLPKPFQVDDIITAIIKSSDRFPHSSIAVAKERCISIPDCEFKQDKQVKIKITRDKHNIFTGRVIK
ncbi:MAG: radical SAM protein [Nanoarchaeota archaeon]|nr:radical SAM protein [Nanoarchaeota archaeon]MBU1622108.1 radical SAM protein [Nanoarchaeota archaeon]MBU1974740.1 radical SAM protein [Nanoarchaeota archaeon]